MFGDNGCCGFQLKKGGPTFFGAITLSFPMIILGAILVIILTPFSLLSWHVKRIRKQTLLILQANVRLINNLALCSRMRCISSGKIFLRFPRLSGFVYRNFNSLLLIIVFALGFFVFFTIVFSKGQ